MMHRCSWAWSLFTRVPSFSLLIIGGLLVGCAGGPKVLPREEQKPIDRKYIEYPTGTELVAYATGLTAPTAMAFDPEGQLLVAESGIGGGDARVIGFKPSGEMFEVWPRRGRFPFQGGAKLHGPIGGIVAANGYIYVTHRDADDRGVVTRLDYVGGPPKTIVSNLPARGDHSVTDIAVAKDGRLFFGVGSATNSGVVGLDNLSWVRQYRGFCDQPWTDQKNPWLYLSGHRFNTPNPFAGLFGGTDLAITAPFQAFGESLASRVHRAKGNAPTAAIYSVSPEGGDPTVEAFGIRHPVGLTFNEVGRLFFTNQGMKLRGTRPVKDDPDSLLRLVSGQWYGWPDFATNFLPIHDPRFQPDSAMLAKTGYLELAPVIDHARSNLRPPAPRDETLLAGEFMPLSGAAKFDFVPSSGPFVRFRPDGRDVAVVALSGDRRPFDTGGQRLRTDLGRIGYRVVAVRVGTGQVQELVYNASSHNAPWSELPQAERGPVGLERPYDVKFGPDGAMYILDFGRMEMRDGRPRVSPGTGRIFKLVASQEAAQR